MESLAKVGKSATEILGAPVAVPHGRGTLPRASPPPRTAVRYRRELRAVVGRRGQHFPAARNKKRRVWVSWTPRVRKWKHRSGNERFFSKQLR